MKYKNKIGMVLVAGGMLAAASCSDFSDYNTAVQSSDPAADKSLWENISAMPEITDFAQVLQSVGYDAVLDAPTTYTVWAPLNGTFNKDSLLSLAQGASTRKLVIGQFVYDHIANYAHYESNPGDTVVYMLSKKLIRFSGKNTDNLTFDGKSVNKYGMSFNTPSSNGLIYTINGMVPFRPNAYENIFTDKSMYNVSDIYFSSFVKKYEKITLDEDASVKGEIVNGMQVYDDSVTVTSNSFVTGRFHLNADLSNEDSLYTVIIPTDAAWQKAYDRIKAYYNYIPSIKYQNLSSSSMDGKKGGTCPLTTTGKATILAATTGVDDASAYALSSAPSDAEIQDTKVYWTDSLAKRWIVRNSAFSENNRRYNSKLSSGIAFTKGDTLRSTAGNKLTNLRNLDNVTVLRQQLSNGHALIVNEYPFHSFETYAPLVKSRIPDRVVSTSGYTYDSFDFIPSQFDESFCKLDKDETSLSYVRATLPEGSNYAPEMDFYLNDVLSTTYDIYAVVVPGLIEGDTSLRPYTLRFDLHYTDEKNTPQTGRLDGDTIQTTIAKISKVAAFENDPTKVDTLYLGHFTFPICYYGTTAAPNIKVMSTLGSFSQSNRNKYDAQIRIASIILKPRDLVEYEKNATKED